MKQTICQNQHNKRSDNCICNLAFSAAKCVAADQRRGDGTDRKACAERSINAAKEGHVHDSRYSGQDTDSNKNDHCDLLRLDSGDRGRRVIGTRCVDLTAKHGSSHYKGKNPNNDDGNQKIIILRGLHHGLKAGREVIDGAPV